MVTYLQLLNRARNRQGNSDLSANQIGSGIGDAIQGIQAVNNAVAVFYDNSYDLDADERATDINTVIGQTKLTAPSESWDTNVIKAVKYKDNTNLKPLALISLEQAEDYKLKTFDTNAPRFWYVNNGEVFILPEPTAVYTIKVFYQKMYPDISVDEINATIMLPRTALKTLQDGVYAYLREQIGDPEWEKHYAKFERQVLKFYERNKHTMKRRGIRKIRVRPNPADRRL